MKTLKIEELNILEIDIDEQKNDGRRLIDTLEGLTVVGDGYDTPYTQKWLKFIYSILRNR